MTATADLLAILKPVFGDRITDGRGLRDAHSKGEGHQEPGLPDLVAFPETTEEVALAVKEAAVRSIPIVAWGAGTSLEGHVHATQGGLCLDLSAMDQIIALNQADMDVRVGAGMRRKALNDQLRDTGLHFPIDPGADATVGGMVATRASGTNAVRYGTMREQLLGLTVVLADGRIIKTGGRARKSAAGYDLTHLFCGQEGTLGIVTEVLLKLHPIPEHIAAAVCQFPTLEAAVDCVTEVMAMAVPMARIELLDDVATQASIAYSKLQGFEALPTLFLEFSGSETSVSGQTDLVQGIADAHGGTAFRWATKAEDRNALWAARHEAYFAALALGPGKESFTTDVCVPMSELAGCIARARKVIDDAGLTAPILGHVGDGNFHCLILADPNDEEEMHRAWAADQAIVEDALRVGGTSTGEHGIGIAKKDFLIAEHGDAVEVMRTLKAALDPKNILNPGKVV